jgi:diguanylate cyclase (GGDEF)-like protein
MGIKRVINALRPIIETSDARKVLIAEAEKAISSSRLFAFGQRLNHILRTDYQQLSLQLTAEKKKTALLEAQLGQVMQANTALDACNKALEETVDVEPMTGLKNRRFFERRIEEEFQRSVRYNHPLSLLSFDIDHFKLINDSHGHPLGDMAIKEIGKIMTREMRSTDHLVRMGGEEFVVILPDTETNGALILAERLRAAVEKNRLLVDGITISMTISVGVSVVDNQPDAKTLVKHADIALYFAKNNGRNRVALYDPDIMQGMPIN